MDIPSSIQGTLQKSKLDFEFNKIHSTKAKETTSIWYREALRELDN